MAQSFRASLTATAVLIQTGETSIQYLSAQNPDTADGWIQFFDAAAAADVTLGTTTPTASFWVPTQGARSEAALMIRGAKGLVYAATTTSTGSTAPGTALVIEHLVYG